MSKDIEALLAPEGVRNFVMAHPDTILKDPDLLAALVSADDATRGGNVIDLRGMALDLTEQRLEELETTHQTVLSAAYDNVATTQQVHRAILAMIAPLDLEGFLRGLSTDVTDILRVGSMRIMLESQLSADCPPLPPSPVLVPVNPGEIELYLDTWRSGRNQDFVLRRVNPELKVVHDLSGGRIQSEALMRLELGSRYPAGLLVMGACDAGQYQPGQATDLLELFGRVFERTLRSLLP